MKSNQLEFDPVEHKYSHQGFTVPSVSQIISNLGLINTFGFNESAANRGRLVHEITEKIDKQIDFDAFDVDPDCVGYLHAYEKFRNEFKGVVIDSEFQVFDQINYYAGTADRVVEQTGARYILDIKTGAFQPWHKLQLGGYWNACHEKYGLCNEGLILSLKKDGSFKVQVVDGMKQFANLFLSCCAVYHFKNQTGSKK